MCVYITINDDKKRNQILVFQNGQKNRDITIKI